jgi:hypothetical protein
MTQDQALELLRLRLAPAEVNIFETIADDTVNVLRVSNGKRAVTVRYVKTLNWDKHCETILDELLDGIRQDWCGAFD